MFIIKAESAYRYIYGKREPETNTNKIQLRAGNKNELKVT